MKRKILYKSLLPIIIAFLSMGVFGQTSDHPPQPMMNQVGTQSVPGEECADDGDSTTPPPGLCLPINDYIFPFIIVGIILGAYKTKMISVNN
ncbi:MAG TPA: hypothetical protein VFM60_05240 [Salinimicrobium sp.]|nr:hypothetical protein [Salinimicrobium sp.]